MPSAACLAEKDVVAPRLRATDTSFAMSALVACVIAFTLDMVLSKSAMVLIAAMPAMADEMPKRAPLMPEIVARMEAKERSIFVCIVFALAEMLENAARTCWAPTRAGPEIHKDANAGFK